MADYVTQHDDAYIRRIVNEELAKRDAKRRCAWALVVRYLKGVVSALEKLTVEKVTAPES